MIRKLILISIMGLTLAGAAVASTPLPVVLAMAGLILLAVSSASHGERQK